ncbi:hypothetical protein C5E16_10645 [Clavibacter michiganensis]|uniref:Uncharacterized protein n=1 Tax=Clavibacter michiganensis TaxID=28447 RepID=A0A2S5VSQ1_9MICO|nr:hypothetical protein [Clavibacter michiganensis]PPF66734.1 hypothetical protein C5E16_10645 [Clavibacter michiganensis]
MTPRAPATFREQAEGALSGFAGFAAYLLWQVARGTEVRTEGDRVLVVVCAIGAIVLGAAFLLLVVHGGIRRRRARRAQADGADRVPAADAGGRAAADAGPSAHPGDHRERT